MCGATLILALLLSACGGSGGASPSAAATPAVDLAAADLDLLLERLERTHPEPFHAIPREAWIAELEALAARLPDLAPPEAMVELMRVVALLSREGRDGHQFALPTSDSIEVLPLRVWEFEEGLFVTDATAGGAGLVGSRITALAGRPIADVLAAIEPLVPRDGPATVPSFRPLYLLRLDVLRGLGIIGLGESAVTLTVDGRAEPIAVEAITLGEHVAWAGELGMLRLPPGDDPPFRVEELEGSGTLYLRYRQVQRVPTDALAIVRERAGAPDVDRVIVDLRQNPGGDNTTYRQLLGALQADDVNVPGRLFVLIDRTTFSAASNLATEIERTTDATFVGEPMGGGLNFWNDVAWVELEHWPIPMRVGVSTRYWQMGVPDDPRLTIEPDIAVPSRAADFFAGRDAALEAALAA
jgi:hypothetical protein